MRSFNYISARLRRNFVVPRRLVLETRDYILRSAVAVSGHYYSNFYFHTGYPISKNNHEGRKLTFAALITSDTLTTRNVCAPRFFFTSLRTPYFVRPLLSLFEILYLKLVTI